MSKRPSDLRELYTEALEEAREAMHADGLVFTDEMRTLVVAWLHTRRALGDSAVAAGPIYAEPGELDHENPSPANILLHHARNTQPGRLAGITLPRPREERPRRIQPRPAANKLISLHRDPDAPRPRPGPGRWSRAASNDQLRAVLNGDAPPIPVPRGLVRLKSLANRCSSIGSRCPTHRLQVTEQPDGTLLIDRTPRPPE